MDRERASALRCQWQFRALKTVIQALANGPQKRTNVTPIGSRSADSSNPAGCAALQPCPPARPGGEMSKGGRASAIPCAAPGGRAPKRPARPERIGGRARRPDQDIRR